jgi:cytidylate kinase
VARGLARALGWRYLDSGAFYRAVAWQTARLSLDPEDLTALGAFLAGFAPEAGEDARGFFLLLDGRRLTQELRSPEVSRGASRMARIPAVRRWVTQRLRRLAVGNGLVAEGRDLGSVVFPEADVKFYLDADLTVRAARRQREQQGYIPDSSLTTTIAEIAHRDDQDRTRDEAPLTIPEGALVVDTTRMQPEEVVARCLMEIRRALKAFADCQTCQDTLLRGTFFHD